MFGSRAIDLIQDISINFPCGDNSHISIEHYGATNVNFLCKNFVIM